MSQSLQDFDIQYHEVLMVWLVATTQCIATEQSSLNFVARQDSYSSKNKRASECNFPATHVAKKYLCPYMYVSSTDNKCPIFGSSSGTAYALVFACDKQTLSRLRWKHFKVSVSMARCCSDHFFPL